MDLATILGLIVGFGAVLGGNVLEGGHISALVGPAAAIIVVGGTAGCVMVQFTMGQLISGLKASKKAVLNPKTDMAAIMQEILGYASKARKEGILALEKDLETIKDPFLKRALSMAVDGVNPKHLEESMETEMAQLEEEGEHQFKMWEAAGAFAPTMGILGAVLGLIHVMANLSNPDELGHGIGVAFVATVYGVALANLILMPLSGKIKNKNKHHMVAYELMLVGVQSILAGENPRFIEHRLKGFLDEKQRKKLEAGAGAAAGGEKK